MKGHTMRLSPSTLAIIENPAPGKRWGHMQPEVIHSSHIVRIDTMQGTDTLALDTLGLEDPPADDGTDESAEAILAWLATLAPYLSGGVTDPEGAPAMCSGFVCRMSAPGYSDCTDWTYCETDADVRAWLEDEAEGAEVDDDTDSDADDDA